MEVSLMKVAARVNDVESKFATFNLSLDYWLAKDMWIVTNVELSTPRSKWCMLLHLSIMSAPSPGRPNGSYTLSSYPNEAECNALQFDHFSLPRCN